MDSSDIVALLISVLFIATIASAAPLLVPSQYPTIQAGIDAAVNGDEVIVALGTYTGQGNRNIDFKGKAITVKSESGPESCIIDCNDISDELRRGFSFRSGEGANSILDGFTIENANFYNGAGVYCLRESSPTIINCIIRNNKAGDGAAIFCDSASNPKIINCVITDNTAEDRGGGIYCSHSCPVITNCVISNNTARRHDGGGIFCGCNPTPASILNITNCTINGNSAGDMGGGIYNCGNLTISDSNISGNSSASGGGIWTNNGNQKITRCKITGNKAVFSREPSGLGGGILDFGKKSIIRDSLIVGNAAGLGGGIWCKDYKPTIINCTITENVASGAGGSIYCEGRDIVGVIRNCVLWNEGISENVPEMYLGGSSNFTVSYTDVRGGQSGIYLDIHSTPTLVWGSGNIDSDPCFVNAGYWDPNSTSGNTADDFWIDGDYHLLAESPCINTGDPNYTVEPNETDLDDNPRVMGGRIDMGAYEFPIFNTAPVACIVDGNQTIEAQGPFGAKVTLDGSCSSDEDSTPGTNDDINDFNWYEIDPCNVADEIFLGSGQIIDCNLPLGTHTIVLEVTDKAGATDSNEITVTIEDTTPPEFNFSVTPTILWPANHKMIKITPTCAVTDLCDPSPQVSLVNVACNEPHSKNDILITESGLIFLRAERSGTSHSRIYTVTYRANDCSGNSTTRSAVVIVPHDFRRRF